ncbi:MAG: hypothetical protein KI788_03965 [Mameliella sp.]|nr:hypothetical protein [Mameliella sp.]
MTTPKIDTRRLKRLDNGMFTMERASDLPPHPGLCETCGRIPCPVKAPLEGIAYVTVGACGRYIPSIGFSVLDGLDLPAWNTVRVGAAWPKRLAPGDFVCIVDTRSNSIVRHMQVDRMVTDMLGRIIEHHAADNHAILAKQPEDPAAELRRILRNAYGTNFAAPTRKGTALYLKTPD